MQALEDGKVEIQGDHMHRGHRLVSSLFLAAALVAPSGIMATSAFAQPAQDEHHDKDHRYYDEEHKDYHDWDAHEDAAYRKYLKEQHRTYRAFDKMQAKEQQEYWHWRHDHPDHD
jgi:hypothetical protein